MRLDTFAFSSKGGRDRNEDAVLVQCHTDKGIFVVADGLGGHQDGDVASQSTVAFLEKSWMQLRGIAFSRVWMEATIQRANENLMLMQEKDKSNMRCTLAMLLIDGERSAWANIGDSRVYYIRDGELSRVTEDHSMAFLRFKAGDIKRSELAEDPDQSRLLRSMGDKERNLPDIYENSRRLKAGDAFLLCSDGIWEYLTDMEVAVDYLKSLSAREWGERLLLRIMERIRKDNDNLSLITVRLC